MRIGVPAEIKNNEFRVAMTPAGVHALAQRGHEVAIQAGAGRRSRLPRRRVRRRRRDDRRHGSRGLVGRARAEGQGADRPRVRLPAPRPHPLHLPPPRGRPAADPRDPRLGRHRDRLRDRAARRPLAPAAHPDERGRRPARASGGRRAPARLEGRPRHPARAASPAPRRPRSSSSAAASRASTPRQSALGMGADVTVFDISLPRLRELDVRYDGRIRTLASSPYEIAAPGAGRRSRHRRRPRPGRRGAEGRHRRDGRHDEAAARCSSTSPSTRADASRARAPRRTHDPTYRVHDAIFYCVANMPGAVPATSTPALTNATLPYALRIAD